MSSQKVCAENFPRAGNSHRPSGCQVDNNAAIRPWRGKAASPRPVRPAGPLVAAMMARTELAMFACVHGPISAARGPAVNMIIASSSGARRASTRLDRRLPRRPGEPTKGLPVAPPTVTAIRPPRQARFLQGAGPSPSTSTHPHPRPRFARADRRRVNAGSSAPRSAPRRDAANKPTTNSALLPAAARPGPRAQATVLQSARPGRQPPDQLAVADRYASE